MSTPTGLIPARPAINPLGLTRQTNVRIEPVDGRVFAAGAVVTADLAYLVGFRVATPFAASAMEYLCSIAAGNVDMGIFSTLDFNAFTLLASTGATLAAGSNVIQSINLTAGVTLVPSVDYFAALVGNNATLSVGRIAGFATMWGGSRSVYAKAALNPLASFSTPASGALLPWLAIK